MRISETKDGCIVEVSVKPRSKEFRIVLDVDDVVVYSREEPVNGRVNKELIKEFQKLFKKRVELITGYSSKQKKLFVKGASKKEVEDRLKQV